MEASDILPIICHRIDCKGVGALRGQRHIPRKINPSTTPPPRGGFHTNRPSFHSRAVNPLTENSNNSIENATPLPVNLVGKKRPHLVAHPHKPLIRKYPRPSSPIAYHAGLFLSLKKPAWGNRQAQERKKSAKGKNIRI